MAADAALSVGVLGAKGRMGQLTVSAVSAVDDLRVGACLGRGDSWDAVDDTDILIDFTSPSSALENVERGLDLGKHIVVGTSGITQDALRTIGVWCARTPDLGVHIVPNFSIAAVLAHTYTAAAARVLTDAEIVEFAGPHKLDAPSGTANALGVDLRSTGTARSGADGGARGDRTTGVPIHSVRLPGFLSRQTAYLSNEHELLTISFETHSREAFAPGILLALRNVSTRPGLRVGLTDLLPTP